MHGLNENKKNVGSKENVLGMHKDIIGNFACRASYASKSTWTNMCLFLLSKFMVLLSSLIFIVSYFSSNSNLF